MHKLVVLLSATIHCEGSALLKRYDPALREADYMWAIKSWMQVENYDTLIFCENSGADLTKLESYATSLNKNGRKLIFLSCNKNAEANERGKGYGEMEIIRHAMDTAELAPAQRVVKVTGRYRARNASRLFREVSASKGDLFCTLRWNLTFADSRLFAITVQCAREHLLSRQGEINDLQGHYFEHVLADTVHATILAGGRWSPLPCDPGLYGFSGTRGTGFGISPISRIKTKVSHMLTTKMYRS
jgi:hypothetical protein